jgi:hypothetical protein
VRPEGDEVTLSSTARALADALQQDASEPDDRQADDRERGEESRTRP